MVVADLCSSGKCLRLRLVVAGLLSPCRLAVCKSRGMRLVMSEPAVVLPREMLSILPPRVPV